MKKLITFWTLFTAITISSCTSLREIGQLNMVSNRNVDLKENYVQLRTYQGSSKSELKKLRGNTLQQALDNVVKNVPGGEFLMNVHIYLLKGKYFAMEGDVWGNKGNDANFQGFHVGDKVQWTTTSITLQKTTHTGVITELKDATNCTVKEDGTGKLEVLKYSDILKTN